jgi:16S rRNA G527 N7-methylase RsmG
MRAVASLGKSLSLVDAIAAEGARFVTFKGPAWQSEVEAARAQMEQLGWTLVDARQIPWAKPKLLLLERQSSSGLRIART